MQVDCYYKPLGNGVLGLYVTFFYVFMVNDSKKGHQLFWRYEEIFLPPLEKPEMTSLPSPPVQMTRPDPPDI